MGRLLGALKEFRCSGRCETYNAEILSIYEEIATLMVQTLALGKL